MQTNYKGAVTIYLMLIFPLLCSLFIACIHSARYSMCRLETEKALELGLLSTFAEFNRELLERYDIFGIDTSYGTKNASYHYTEQHLLEYTKYKKMEVVGTFSDEGKSGKSVEGRPDFSRMIALIEENANIDGTNNLVDFVIVFKLSRFGRNAADTLSTLRRMKNLPTLT